MKFLFLALILITSFLAESKAQRDTLVINLKNSQEEKIAVSQIQKIRFENINSVNDQSLLPQQLNIKGNYPNPIENQTSIEFVIATAGDVEIVIYDNAGNEIQKLVCGGCQAGQNKLTWNCLDKRNNRVLSGVYYYEVRFGSEVQARKMIVVK